MRGKDISDGAIAIMTKGMPVGAPIAGPMVLGLGLGFKIGLVLKFGFENLRSYCDLLYLTRYSSSPKSCVSLQ